MPPQLRWADLALRLRHRRAAHADREPARRAVRVRLRPPGARQRETTFDGRVLDYRYSKASRLARVAHPDGTFREFSYDVLGNVVEEHAPDGDVVFERDERGRLLKAILTEYGGKVVNEFERDRLGRIVAETQNGRTIRYEHDARGRRAARILPGGQTTRYHYDPLGALVALDHDGHRVAIERDVLGRETRRHVYRGHVDIQSAYDALDRLTDQRVSAPAPTGGGALAILSQRHFGYDAGGRLTRVDDARWGTTEYRYDAIGQLVEARRGALHEVFEYDVTGSLVNVLGDLGGVGRVAPWFVEPGNILTRTPDAVYENDERGRRIAKVPIEDGEARPEKATRYGWDIRDRLREVLLPTGERVQYTYDAFGRRVRKQVIPAERGDFAAMTKLALEKGASALPKPRVTEFLWDGDVLAAELDPERGPRIHVHEPGTFVPALQAEGGEVFTVVNDHLGMPKELVDEDGRVAWAAAHSAWGRVTDVWRDPRRAAKGLPEVESPFRLLGQYADDDVGLCYTRFRWFDPERGRWCSPDPLGVWGSGNTQSWFQSPTVMTDPLGLVPLDQGGYLVYGLFRDGESEPYYVGITNNSDRREDEHVASGRLDLAVAEMVPIPGCENLTYAQARGHEQALIEHYGTKPSDRKGKFPGNIYNSFDHAREDPRGQAFQREYERKRAELTPPCKR